MKELFIISLAVLTKQHGQLNFAENVTVALDTREEAEAFIEQLNALNDKYRPLYDEVEPITLLGTPLCKHGSVTELAALVDVTLQNGEKRFAEYVGQQIPDTDSELERIRRSKS